MQAEKVIPGKLKMKFHTALIKFGRNICKAKNPLCSDCDIMKYCEYDNKTKSEKYKTKQNNFIILENI
jgi:endonuclease-3